MLQNNKEDSERKEREEKTRKLKLQRQEQQRMYQAEKKRLLDKKKTLQEGYQMLRWVTEYIDKNKSYWETRRITRIENEKKALEQWDKLARQEKMDEIIKASRTTRLTKKLKKRT